MKLLAFLCMAGMALSTPLDKIGVRVDGGTQVAAGDVKFMAAVEVGSNFLCGGVLINKNAVLTGSYCARVPTDKIKVRVGSLERLKGGQERKLKKKFINPLGKANGQNDIAILILATPIVEGDQVEPIEMYSSANIANKNVTVAGWGSITSSNEDPVNDLHKVTVKVLSDKECKDYYGDKFNPTFMFCTAGPNGACQKDYSGPAYITEGGVDKLIGLVMQPNKCDMFGPGLYTEISKFRKWILDTINPKPKILEYFN